MQGKKKLLVLVGTTLALSLGVAFTAASFSGGVFSYNEGRKDNGVFVLDQSSVHRDPNSDIVRAVMLSSGKNTVNIRLKDVTIDDQSRLVVNTSKFTIISNEVDSPIRGISSLDFNIKALEQNSRIVSAVYYSYNHLNIDDIMAGKYQDLKPYIYENYLSYSDAPYSQPFNTPSDLDARYFLIAIGASQGSVSLESMTVSTPCAEDGEPDPVAVGEYPGYSEAELSLLPPSFPYVGNGSYKIEHYNYGDDGVNYIYLFQPKGTGSSIASALEAAGYEPGEYQGMQIYQKFAYGEKYHTVVFQPSFIGNGYEYVPLMSMLYGKLIVSNTWPQDDIVAPFSDSDFIALISDPGFASNSEYMADGESSSNYKVSQVEIGFNKNIDDAIANYNAIVDFKDKFITAGYKRYSFFEYQEPTAPDITDDTHYHSGEMRMTLMSPDCRHKVEFSYYTQINEAQIYHSSATITFWEYELSTFPEATLSDYFGGWEFVSIPGESTYVIDEYYSYNYSYSNRTAQKRVKLYSSTLLSATISSYLSSLEVAGWTVSGLNAIKVDSSTTIPTYISVSFVSDTIYEITFESGVMTSIEYSLESAINQLTYWDIDNVVESFVEDAGFDDRYDNPYRYYVSQTNRVVYCEGYSSDDLDTLLGIGQYNEVLGKYIYSKEGYDRSLLYDASFDGEYLIIQVSSISNSNIEILTSRVNLAAFNEAIDACINTGTKDVSDFSVYHAQTEGNYYYIQGGQLSIIDTQANVNAIVDAYKAHLESNSLIQYSSYLGKYIHSTEHVAVNIGNIENISGSIYSCTIYFEFDVNYVDFVPYSEIHVSTVLGSKFPSLHVDDNKHFIENGYSEESLDVYADKAFVNNYALSLLGAGFTQNDDSYIKVENGDLLTVNISTYYSTYSCIQIQYNANYFKTMVEVKEQLDNDTLFNKYVLPSDEGSIFHLDGWSDNSLYIYYVESELNLSAYRDKLDDANYMLTEESYNSIVYYALVGNEVRCISIYTNDNGMKGIRCEVTNTYDNLLSQSQFEVQLVNVDFDMNRYNSFVMSSTFGNNIYVNSIYANGFTLVIVDQDFTLSGVETYKQELEDANYTLYSTDNTYYWYYSCDNAYIRIERSGPLYTIIFEDFTHYFGSYSDVETSVLSQMKSSLYKEFVKPTQAGDIYEVRYCGENWFDFYAKKDSFNMTQYIGEVTAAGYSTMAVAEENEVYAIQEKGLYIYIGLEEDPDAYLIEFYCSNPENYRYTYDEIKNKALSYGLTETALAKFVDPAQPDAEYDHIDGVGDTWFNVVYDAGTFNSDNYMAQLYQAGFELASSSENDYYQFEKDGVQIIVRVSESRLEFCLMY